MYGGFEPSTTDYLPHPTIQPTHILRFRLCIRVLTIPNMQTC